MLISYKTLPKIAIGCMLTALFATGAVFAIDANYQASNAPAMQTLSPHNFTVPLLEGGVSITNSPKLVTMSLRESDTRQVLRMLADKAGMNIILHESVSGNVTLDLVNVTLNKAFEYVMLLNDLAYWIDGNTLIIAGKSAQKDLAFSQQKIKTFDVKYENAGRIAEFLNKNIYKLKNPGLTNDEIAITNPSTNQIMIVGTDKDFEIAEKIIAQFDKKVETVMFKTNHLAPGKMAGIICHKVFKTDDIKDESDESEGKGGAKIACSSKDIEGAEVDGTFSSFKGGGMVVSYYPDLGTIGIAGATLEQLKFVDEIITQNDVKQPQAILEIAVLELSAHGTRSITPNWGVYSGTFSMSNNAGLQMNFRQDNGDKSGLYYDVQLAMTQGKGRVLTNPKILVKNNVETTFEVTQEYISDITTQISTSTIQPVNSQDVETDNYGITVTIKPTITPDGYIYLDLNPSYQTPNGSFQVDSSDENKKITLIAERSIELKGIRLKDNETLIIGGLISETEQKDSTKVPFLGDLPILGAAFRTSNRTSDKTELIIIVTPKIVKDDEMIMERM